MKKQITIEVKNAISPVVEMLRELNTQVKNDDIDIDFLVKLVTTMRVSTVKIDKTIKENKMNINGGVKKE
jgi:hypothetical protein